MSMVISIYILSILLLISFCLNIRYVRAYRKAMRYNERLFKEVITLQDKVNAEV